MAIPECTQDNYIIEEEDYFNEERIEIPYKSKIQAQAQADKIKDRFENENIFKECIKSAITRDGGIMWYRGVGLAQEWINLQFQINLATDFKVI